MGRLAGQWQAWEVGVGTWQFQRLLPTVTLHEISASTSKLPGRGFCAPLPRQHFTVRRMALPSNFQPIFLLKHALHVTSSYSTACSRWMGGYILMLDSVIVGLGGLARCVTLLIAFCGWK